jgi:hypothetical protein
MSIPLVAAIWQSSSSSHIIHRKFEDRTLQSLDVLEPVFPWVAVSERKALDYSLDGIFHLGHTTYMAWEIEFTDEFSAWWGDLSADEQEEIAAKVELLEERGPSLPRPHADRIESSRHSNMKELRGKVQERHLRVLFAFDPRRTAVLLLGGDKTDDPKWYDKFVPIADNLFDQHLKKIEQDRQKKKQKH